MPHCINIQQERESAGEQGDAESYGQYLWHEQICAGVAQTKWSRQQRRNKHPGPYCLCSMNSQFGAEDDVEPPGDRSSESECNAPQVESVLVDTPRQQDQAYCGEGDPEQVYPAP